MIEAYTRREIITVRGQSYVSRIPKYWPPHPPLRPASVSSPRNKGGGYLAGRRGAGGSIFWKTPAIGLASYNNLSRYLAHRFLDDLCPVPDDEEPDDGRDDDHVEWPEVVTWHKKYTKKLIIFANIFVQMFTFAKEFTKRREKLNG